MSLCRCLHFSELNCSGILPESSLDEILDECQTFCDILVFIERIQMLYFENFNDLMHYYIKTITFIVKRSI